MNKANRVIKKMGVGGTWTKKTISLVIVLALLAVTAGMSMLSGSGSTALANILDAISDWSELIALGVALGLFFYFMPKK